MVGTVYEMIHGEGREVGFVEGQRECLQRQLEFLFGPLNEAVLGRMTALTAEQLDALTVAILSATSLQDLGLAD